MGKQILNLDFMGLTGDETIKIRAIENCGNMVSVAVVLLDSTVLSMRLLALDLS